MAYYLQSLVRVIELILSDEKQQKYFDNVTISQLQSLMEKACSLRDAFAKYPTLSHQQDSFDDQIRDAAQNAEDVLETYVASFATDDDSLWMELLKRFVQIASSTTERSVLPRDMQMLHESFDSVKKEMMKILDADQTPSADHTAPLVVASSRLDRNPENIMVGMTYELLQLKERVFGESSKLEIIPIVGMGGIGKTTLARKLYDDSSVVSQFDARAWATVSDEYSFHDILLDLLCSITKNRRNEIEVEDNKLGVTIYQHLMGKRFVIVLDDIWRFNAWDDVKKCFPNENKGSRIILTTRQSHVATYVDSKSLHHHVRPLGMDDSWELLRKKVFGKETCLRELEEVGKRIANSCRGLPLAVQVIAGILSHIERTKSSWEQVASKVISAIANEEEQVSSILALSYNNLPYYLKPCFLYMSVFPEDFEIEPSTLIRLWIAEGFLIPILRKSLEEVAEEHFHALIDRNLIFVRERCLTEDIVTLGIHDLLRNLCVLEAGKKKFFHVVNGRIDLNASRDMSCLRRVSVFTPCSIEDIYVSTRQKQMARSLLAFRSCNGQDAILPHGLSTLRLLSGFVTETSEVVTQGVNLRYLTLMRTDKLNPMITTFRNLHFLIIDVIGGIDVPYELFEMPQLREIAGTSLDCDFGRSSKDLVLQKKLYSLPILLISYNIDVVLAKFPNLKKLGLMISFKEPDPKPIAPTISCLQKIETLSVIGDNSGAVANYLMECSFANTLTKFSIHGFTVPKAFMTTLSMLPSLETLSLTKIRFEDTEDWKLSEGKFCRLKSLYLRNLSLVTLEADETHFPILMQLNIEDCKKLVKLPTTMGEIPTLVVLFMHNSSPAADAWARQIQEEQLDYGNELLQVYVLSRRLDFYMFFVLC